MAESITYGSYTFPDPTPLVGQGVSPVYVGGKVDHFMDSVDLVGNLTGENLSGLHLQKMTMISGLLSEFQTLTITNDDENKTFPNSKPESITFNDSNLTTFLPYSVGFVSYSSGSFSQFYGIESPQDKWVFTEENGKVTSVTHSVSAKGLKVGSSPPFINARHFVTGRATGCIDLSLFQTGGGKSFLLSRDEEINKSSNSYSITENYKYSTSENPVTDSGIFTNTTQISYEKEAGLNVRVNASIQGSFTGNVNQVGLVHTGLFTANQAQEIAVNAVASSLSDYESGAYTFINRSPKTASYNIDTGANKIDFSYEFRDPSNLDQEGNILHNKISTVSASKDESIVQIKVQGGFLYNGPFDVFNTGDPATGERFKELDAAYSGVANRSGFLNLAIEALIDFREDASGYHISGNYVNETPTAESVNKSPPDSTITYAFDYDNKIDLSSGTLSGLKVSVVDKRPIIQSGIIPTIAGFAKQRITDRTAGEYSVSARCEASTGDLQTLKDVISGHMTGIYRFSESSSVNDDTISYNAANYY